MTTSLADFLRSISSSRILPVLLFPNDMKKKKTKKTLRNRRQREKRVVVVCNPTKGIISPDKKKI